MNTPTPEASLENNNCYRKGTLLESQWLKTLDVINLLVKEHESKRNDTCDEGMFIVGLELLEFGAFVSLS